MNNLSAKEVGFISDLMTYEAEACKKARLYSKTLTEQTIATEMATLASNHEKRFTTLLNLL